MSYIYETEEGDTFAMCPVCVLTTQDVEGEYHCHGCQQWYLIRPPGERVCCAAPLRPRRRVTCHAPCATLGAYTHLGAALATGAATSAATARVFRLSMRWGRRSRQLR